MLRSIVNDRQKRVHITGVAYLHDFQGPNLACVLNMGTPAKINERTTTIDGAVLSFDEIVDVMQFVLAVREHLFEVFFGDIQSFKCLLLLAYTGCFLVQRRPVRLPYNLAMGMLVVVVQKIEDETRGVTRATTHPSRMAIS